MLRKTNNKLRTFSEYLNLHQIQYIYIPCKISHFRTSFMKPNNYLTTFFFFNSPEKFKRDIFPTKVFGSVEKLPGEKPVPDNAIKGKHSTNCNDREAKENNQGATNDDEQGRHRTYSLGEKGLKTNGSSTKNGVTPPISNTRPGYNHASSTGTTRAVVGTCNENFFKQPPKKAAVKDSPPINNTVSQTAKVKQRRFRVESSDR